MKEIYFIIIYIHKITAKLSDIERIDLCKNLHCNETINQRVCGMRKINGKSFYKIFDNECLLLKYGCKVDENDAYGIINTSYCNEHTLNENYKKACPNCQLMKIEPVCGIREDYNGFRVRLFGNKCQLEKHNCQQNLQFNSTNLFICYNTDLKYNTNNTTEINNSIDSDISIDEENKSNGRKFNWKIDANVKETTEIPDEKILAPKLKTNNNAIKNIIVVDGSASDLLNINNTVADFFAATHVFDLPVREIQPNISENTRRRIVKVFGPIKVFKPWVQIPKNVSEDYYHKPTLSSCFHKCPTKCPSTYAPVCGVPGVRAREPSLMFKNHCFMDVAQCKMFWEDKSETAESSAYIEASFVFCLGEELNGLYRFLPLIRTLQHMGRLKKKGTFKYKFTNMRFFNQLLNRQPKLMG